MNRPPPSSAAAAIRSAANVKYTHDSSADTSASEEPTPESAHRQPSVKAPRIRHVDLIVEDDETPGSLNPTNDIAKRKIPDPLNTVISPPRSRSISSSAAPYPSPPSRPSMGRKSSLSAVSPPPSSSSVDKQQFETGPVPQNGIPHLEINGQIKKKRVVGRNRESLDLDDIMNDFSDEEPAKKSPFTPKSARAIDTSTRDLLSFLNEGPPEGPPPMAQSVSSPRTKQGRFRTMVSRLTRGPSTEKLTAAADSAYPARKSSVPALPVSLPPTLSSKKSLRDLSMAAKIVVPPRPPPMSPPASPSLENGNSLPRTRNTSTTVRKAVPPLERRLTSPDTDINKGVDVKYSDAKSAPVMGEFHFPSDVKQYRTQEYVRPPTTPRKTPAVERKPVMTNGTSGGNLGAEESITAGTVKPPSRESKGSITTKGRHSDTTTTSSPVERPSSQATITGTGAEKRRTSKSHQKDTEKSQIQKVAEDKAKVNGNSLTPTPATPEFGQHAAELRHLMSRASNADECRLLLDMFLIRMGINCELLGPQTNSTDGKNAVDPEQQSSVVEALLTNSDVSVIPSQTIQPSSKELSPTIANGDSQANHQHEPEIAETSMIPPVTSQLAAMA